MAESANQTILCGSGSRLVFENNHTQNRELRFQSPITDVLTLAAATGGDVHCEGTYVYKVFCPSCANPLSNISQTLRATLNAPFPKHELIEYIAENGGGGVDDIPQDQALMGLAGIICATLICYAFTRGL